MIRMIIKYVTALVIAFPSLLSAPALLAQSSAPNVTVKIPFAFQAGLRHFDAGTYTINLLGENTLVIRGASASALDYAIWNSENDANRETKVVFHHYGTQYFLRQVYVAGSYRHLENMESKAEVRARKVQRIEEAANRATSEGVEIALLGTRN